MRNNNTKARSKIRIPELKINEVLNKMINWISHIRHIYWLMGIIFALIVFLSQMPYKFWTKVGSSLANHGIIIGMVLTFCLVAVSLVWSTGQRIDVWVFMYLNMRGHRAPWIDWIMLVFTQIGSGGFALAVAIILYLRGKELLAYEFILGTLTLWAVVELMKVLIRRNRPYIKLNNIRIIGSRASGRSFPSGHTSQSFLMATILINYYHIGILKGLIFYTIALLVGITRVYVGMHYPRDVLAGAILGTTWGLLGGIINNYIG